MRSVFRLIVRTAEFSKAAAFPAIRAGNPEAKPPARPDSKQNSIVLPPRSAAEQDQDAGGDGQDLHDHWETAKVQFEQRDQPGQDEPDAQQEHSQTLGHLDFGHIFTPLKKYLMPCGRPSSVS